MKCFLKNSIMLMNFIVFTLINESTYIAKRQIKHFINGVLTIELSLLCRKVLSWIIRALGMLKTFFFQKNLCYHLMFWPTMKEMLLEYLLYCDNLMFIA